MSSKPKNTNTSKRDRHKNANIEVEPIPGCRDFPPDKLQLQTFLFNKWRQIAKLYNFQEYNAPILEEQQLYQRKAGEDIVKQMYAFTTQDGLQVALRPEMTPTLARMILKANNHYLMPIKWFSIPQCWRYETVTRGRFREHYQWNMDIFGIKDITAEAELLSAIVSFFKSIGVTSKDVGIKVNSRQILEEVLIPLGVTADIFASVCIIIDKLDKLEEYEVVKQLTDLGLSVDIISAIQKTLSIKNIEELKILLPDSEAIKNIESLWKLSQSYGYSDWLIFDASIVRGLAYYTGIVFEVFDRRNKLRAIAGGGRYDKLLSLYGAKQDIPACGFGFGDAVIVELLKDLNLFPKLENQVDYLIVALNDELREGANQVAMILRNNSKSVDLMLTIKKNLMQSFAYADKIGANKIILVMPDEWKNGCVVVKDLKSNDKNKGMQIKITELRDQI